MHFLERTLRDALGSIVIQSRLRPGASRRNFEKQFFRGVEVEVANEPLDPRITVQATPFATF